MRGSRSVKMKMVYKLSKSIKLLLIFLLAFLYEAFYVWMINNTIEYTVDKHVKLIFENGIKKEFICLVLIMLALTAFRQLLFYVARLYNKEISTRIRLTVYSSMIDSAFKENIEKDKLYTLISDNLESLVSVFDTYLDYLLVIAASLASVIYIFTLDIKIVIVLSAIGLALLLYSYVFKGNLYKREEELLEKNENLKKYNNYMYETVLDRAKYSDRKFEEDYEARFNNYKLAFKNSRMANLKYMFIPYILGFAQTYLPILIIYFWNIEITLGELTALLLTITSFMGIFRNTVEYIADLEKKKAAYETIKLFLKPTNELSNEKYEEQYEENSAAYLEIKDLKLKLAKHKLYIGDMNVLKNGLYIISGEKGIGKTTFFRAILGDRTIDYSGNIKLCGKDIRECSRNYIARSVSYMKQDSPIIDGHIRTVFYNINDALTEDQMIKILKAVGIYPDEFKCRDYYNLLDKYIERDKISEGQRQRLSLSYVLARDKNIILLDEPTSHLDRVSKALVMNTLNKLSKEKIVLIISHDNDLISNNPCVYKFKVL